MSRSVYAYGEHTVAQEQQVCFYLWLIINNVEAIMKPSSTLSGKKGDIGQVNSEQPTGFDTLAQQVPC